MAIIVIETGWGNNNSINLGYTGLYWIVPEVYRLRREREEIGGGGKRNVSLKDLLLLLSYDKVSKVYDQKKYKSGNLFVQSYKAQSSESDC